MDASCPKLQWVRVAMRPDVSQMARSSVSSASVLKRAGFDRALFEALASGASGLVERVHAGEPFIGWAARVLSENSAEPLGGSVIVAKQPAESCAAADCPVHGFGRCGHDQAVV